MRYEHDFKSRCSRIYFFDGFGLKACNFSSDRIVEGQSGIGITAKEKQRLTKSLVYTDSNSYDLLPALSGLLKTLNISLYLQNIRNINKIVPA